MNIQNMLKQAEIMQKKMQEAKKNLETKEFTIEKQGIQIIMTGNYELKKIDFHENLLDPDDKDILQDLIKIAINEATSLITKAHEIIQSPDTGKSILNRK